MADKKGILNSEQEKAIASFLDEKVPFENKIAESLDGFIFKGIITIVDDYGLDKLNEKYKAKADALADALFEKNWEVAVLIVWELATMIVKEYISK